MIGENKNGKCDGLTSFVAILEREAIEYLESVFSAASETSLVLVEACEQNLIIDVDIIGTQLVDLVWGLVCIH